MPPSVVCGTVRLALAAQPQPPPPRPSQKSPKRAQPGYRDAKAPQESMVPEPTGWQSTVRCAGHSFAPQLSYSTHPSPEVVSSDPRLAIPKRAHPAATVLLPALRRAAPSALPEPGARASARCGGGAAAGWHSGSLPAASFLRLPVGLDKGHFLGGAGNVPSMPRFVVHGDFLPPQQQQGLLLGPQDWRRGARCVLGHRPAVVARGRWPSRPPPLAEPRPAGACCPQPLAALCALCERPFL